MKEGLIYRSANPDRISRRDLKLLHRLEIKTIIDLRAPYEYGKNKVRIDDIEVISLPLDFEKKTRELLYPWFFRKNARDKISEISNLLYSDITNGAGLVLSRIAGILMEPERSPVLIHCQAGKDRTGIVIAILQMLAGADRETIIAGYMKSNESILPYYRRKMILRKVLTLGYFPAETILFAIEVKKENIITAMDIVEERYGGPGPYLSGSGFDIARMQALKRMLID